MRGLSLILIPCAVLVVLAQDAPRKRNAIIFVADGLRHGSVNATDTPALHRIRTEGVYFANSHSVFPSQTMPNAAAIATGHYPGDTGQVANTLFIGYPVFDGKGLGQPTGSMTPDVEDPLVLADINSHFGGNYLREASLLAFARSYGYNTAAIGKTGPVSAQDVSELVAQRGRLRQPDTIILESVTGTPRGVPLSERSVAWLTAAGLTPAPPPRDQPAGSNETPGTKAANVAHQQWFADAVTKAILPEFAKSTEPFVLVFWSGDPDLTQHAQGDSLNRLTPGVNGPTSKAAVQNADRNLQQILSYLDANPGVRDSTNVFVTSDHGFSTISRRDVDASARPTTSYSATLRYRDLAGRQEVNDGHLPPGFLAIDRARALKLPLYDPEQQAIDERGVRAYVKVEPTSGQATKAVPQRPTGATALIGGTGRISKPTDATVIVSQTSIHVPGHHRGIVGRIVRFLTVQDYVGGIFVNDRLGRFAGALRLSDVWLHGTATMPKPAIVVNFRSFALDARDPLMTTATFSTSTRQHGQGDHGSLTRANTFNNMAAMGPDFKKGFVVRAPVSNADIQPTLARALRMKIPSFGRLRGRVVTEALVGGPDSIAATREVARSRPTSRGDATVLMFQRVGEVRYLDEACFTRDPSCR